MVKLSIITINLNNAIGLNKTIISVVNQYFSDYELIVIDGASSDASVDVIKKYADKITYWISEPDTGIYNAMNKGIKHAKGEYCLFLNSGDWLFNSSVLDDAFKTRFAEDIVYGLQFTEQNGSFCETLFLDPEYLTFRSFLNSSLPHQCSFIKRCMFDVIGLYNENNKIVSDWEWNSIALFRYNCSLKKINIPISVYDTHGISSNQSFQCEHLFEKKRSFYNNFSRLLKDFDECDKLISKYNKIPKLLIRVFNLIR